MAKFSDFSPGDKVILIKQEFTTLVKSIFDTPEVLKTFIDQKLIDNKQSKSILQLINSFNSKTCVCCRRYDQAKVNKMIPINSELEPLVDMARSIAEKKLY
jgi:hypothetical protein